MKKSSIYRILSSFVVLGIFNLIFWLIKPDEMTAARWIAYALIHVSFLLILFTPVLTSKHTDAQVGGFLLRNLSRAYFLLQLVIGIIFLCVWSDSEVWLKVTIGVQGVLFLVYLALLLFVMFASHSNVEAGDKRNANTAARLSVGTLRRIHALCADDEIKEQLQLLIDKAELASVTPAVSAQFDASAKMLERAVRAKDKEKSTASINELVSLFKRK